jgi:hypothetical protein
MAPDCELESFVSFSLRRDWHVVIFESPDRARTALQQQGLNYFLIDLDSVPILDVIQHAPLFQPGTIEKYFQVRWQQGNALLLTWPGPDTIPIPDDFLTLYAHLEQWNPFDSSPLYTQVRTIYEMNKDRPYPIFRDPQLPTVRGWQ